MALQTGKYTDGDFILFCFLVGIFCLLKVVDTVGYFIVGLDEIKLEYKSASGDNEYIYPFMHPSIYCNLVSSGRLILCVLCLHTVM